MRSRLQMLAQFRWQPTIKLLQATISNKRLLSGCYLKHSCPLCRPPSTSSVTRNFSSLQPPTMPRLGELLTEEYQTIAELYQQGAFGKKAAFTKFKPCQELNNKVAFVQASIVELDTDAIVNAANATLLGGGGVDGVIHRAAGPELLEECRSLDGCRPGDAKVTKGYRIPAKIIIHAVGPIAWRYKDSDVRDELLAACYQRSLELLVEYKYRTIAFPCISTGIYGFPPREAADIASRTIREFLESENGKEVDLIVLVMFESKDWNSYERSVPNFFPPTEEDLAGNEEDEGEDTDRAETDEEDAEEQEDDDDDFAHSQDTSR